MEMETDGEMTDGGTGPTRAEKRDAPATPERPESEVGQPGRIRPRIMMKGPKPAATSPVQPAEKRDTDARSPQELPESKVARTLAA